MNEQNAGPALSDFYISCPVGFESHLALEISEVWPWLIGFDNQPNQAPVPSMTKHRGGVLLQSEFHLGIQLNFFLKTAHRILWRLADFKVRDFPKLFERVSKIPWNRYLKSTDVEWVVAAAGSRLNHEKRIEGTCQEALVKSFGKVTGPVSASVSKQKIYVRVNDDLCTLSLDSSGEHLHKRGWGTFKGAAPLRETLAAFLLREMMAGESIETLAKVTLLDPMCGSGTLLLEGASLLQPVFDRPFSFLEWKNAPKIYTAPLWRKNYKKLFTSTAFKAFVGFDADPKALEAARENLKSLREKTLLKELTMEFAEEDLFEGEPRDLGKNWCVLNPPYGERLKVQKSAPVTSEPFSYQDLLQRIADKFSSEKIGLLLPHKAHVKALTPPVGYSKSLEVPFSNGGLDVVYLIYSLKS
jgi:putative N6-adenine-specific DNA methylase